MRLLSQIMLHRIAAMFIACSCAVSAQAATVSYDFTDSFPQVGGGSATKTFANLSVDTATWTFTLQLKEDFSSFGKNAFVGALAIEGDTAKKYFFSDFSSSGVSELKLKNAAGPGGNFDFWAVFGKGNDKLVANEWIKWRVQGMSSLENVSLHIQALAVGKGSDSKWIAGVEPAPPLPPAAVPLPAAVWLFAAPMFAALGLSRVRRRGGVQQTAVLA